MEGRGAFPRGQAAMEDAPTKSSLPRPATLRPASPAFGLSGVLGESVRHRAEGACRAGPGVSPLLRELVVLFALGESHLYNLVTQMLAQVRVTSTQKCLIHMNFLGTCFLYYSDYNANSPIFSM